MVLVSLSRGDVEQAWKFVREMLPLWARPDRREIEGHYGPAESQFAGMLVDTATAAALDAEDGEDPVDSAAYLHAAEEVAGMAVAIDPGLERAWNRLAIVRVARGPPIVMVLAGPPARPGLLSGLARADLFFAIAAGVGALAHGCYSAACQSALVYAEQLRAAFDLYRRRVPVALGLEPAADIQSERQLWADITLFWYRGQLRRTL